MSARYLLSFATLIFLTGCASAPIATDLSSIVENPDEFRNKRIEITGVVLDNPAPQGDEYRTWTFVIGSRRTYRVAASEEGFNPSTIEKAYRLVEEARRAGDEITVTGMLRVGPYREIESGMEVELDSVRYRDTEINTDRGPYVRYYYPYYYHPDPFFYHYGHYHHRHW
jgi:hypothetical protein